MPNKRLRPLHRLAPPNRQSLNLITSFFNFSSRRPLRLRELCVNSFLFPYPSPQITCAAVRSPPRSSLSRPSESPAPAREQTRSSAARATASPFPAPLSTWPDL